MQPSEATCPIRVLLIEDNPTDILVLRQVLAGGGAAGSFTLTTAPTLAAGLGALAIESIDVVLLDLGLPDSWGIQTFTTVATHAPEMPIIVLSGGDDESVALQAVRDGAQDYLVKGQVDGNLLLRAVRYAIERKRAAEALHRLNVELEERVAQRTGQLEATVKELEAFSYSISHDLRAPLRGINGFSHALLEDYSQVLDERGRHYLRRLREATWRMGELIDALLSLSQVMRSELHFGPVDLSAVAHSVKAELQQADPDRDVVWAIAAAGSVTGDARLLRVVMANLLGNACKFTRNREHARIEFGVTGAGADRAYFVRDNGTGFDMRYAAKLFRPFQRLHGTSEYEGTGIGLAMVQRIIERHGGRVWAEGAVGRGATFHFSLPGAGQSPQAEA